MIKLSIAAILTVSFLTAQASHAQASLAQRVDFAATYSASRANVTDGSSFWAQGGSAELGVVVVRHFSAVANLNGEHFSGSGTTQAPLSLLSFTFGPRYSWGLPHLAKQHHTELFGQALVGVAHEFGATLPNSATRASAFALQAGGGVDIGITHSFAIRAIEADWVRTELPNATTGAQNSLRLSAGVVYHF